MSNSTSKIGPLYEFMRAQVSFFMNEKVKTKSKAQLIAGIFAFILGYIGYFRILTPADFVGHFEVLYQTLALLAVRMPKVYPQLPIELQIARFALPAVMAWLTIGVYLDYLRRPLRHYAATKLDDHVVLFGLGERVQATAKQARLAGSNVLVVTNQPTDSVIQSLEKSGIIVVVGDLECEKTLVLAGVSRASQILVATENDLLNLKIAVAIRKQATDVRSPNKTPILLTTECFKPDLWAILEGAFQSMRDECVEYRLLSPEANVARELLPKLIPLLGTPDQPGAILIAGFSNVALSIFSHVLRNAPPGADIAIASSNANHSKDAFFRSCPAYENISGLTFFDADILEKPTLELQDWLLKHQAPVVVIDIGSEEINLRTALALRRFANIKALPTGHVFVRQQGSGIALEALALIEGEPIDLSRIYQFGSLHDECRPQIVFMDELDMLAKIVHEDYRQNADGGESAQPWGKLRETYRQASRYQADHLDAKLQAIGVSRLPLKKGEGHTELNSNEIERLAELEHYRWCVERWLDGWRFGPTKDSIEKTHPMLVHYNELSEEVKEFDRRAVRNVPHLAKILGTCLKKICRLHIAESSFGAERQSFLFSNIKQAQQNNEMPLLEIELDSGAGLDVARWAMESNIAFEIITFSPISEIRKNVDWKPLKAVLEAAVVVKFCFENNCNESASKL